MQAVVDEPVGRAKRTQVFRICAPDRMARNDVEQRQSGCVGGQLRLTTQVARRPLDDIAVEPKSVADRRPAISQDAAHNVLERVQPEVQTRRDAEVAASPTETAEEFRVLVGTGVDNRSIRRDDFCARSGDPHDSPCWAVRCPIPPPRVRPQTPVEATTPPGAMSPTAWVAVSKSSQVAPPPARATRAPASTSTRRIIERSIAARPRRRSGRLDCVRRRGRRPPTPAPAQTGTRPPHRAD